MLLLVLLTDAANLAATRGSDALTVAGAAYCQLKVPQNDLPTVYAVKATKASKATKSTGTAVLQEFMLKLLLLMRGSTLRWCASRSNA